MTEARENNSDEKEVIAELNEFDDPFPEFAAEISRKLDKRLRMLQVAEEAKREFWNKELSF